MQFAKNNLSDSLAFFKFKKTQSPNISFEVIKQILVLLVCSFLFGQIVLGQGKRISSDKELPSYHSNKIYLKLSKDATESIQSPSMLLEGKQTAEIAEMLTALGVKKITTPFDKLGKLDGNFKRVFEVVFSRNQEKLSSLVKQLQNLETVEYAEQIPIMRKFISTNDPMLPQQWSIAQMHTELGWDIHQGGRAVVAIVDDGIFLNHPDLQANIWINPIDLPNNSIDEDGNGYIDDVHGFDVADNDNDPNVYPGNYIQGGVAQWTIFTHGTFCAGIAGAVTNNGIGIAGVGFDNRIMAVKITSDRQQQVGHLQNPFQGVAYAIASNAADVISMSWGGPANSITHQNIMDLANNRGIVLVAAAGNSNTTTPMFPAAYDHVISVAATDHNDVKSGFSNFGQTIDICAPGGNNANNPGILSTVVHCQNTTGSPAVSDYAAYSGTSASCPMVAGLAGLIKSMNPNFSPADIENCLLSTADDIAGQNPNFNNQLGSGRVNIEQALLCAMNQTQCGRDSFEPNDNRYQAQQLPRGGVRRNARICKMGDVDVYKIQIDASQPHVKLIFRTNAPINVDIHFQGVSPTGFVTSNGLVTELKSNNLAPGEYFITLNGQHNWDWDAIEGYSLQVVKSNTPY